MRNTIGRLKKAALLVGCISACSYAYAAGDGWLSIGRAPESEGKGTSIALGFKGESNFGVQLGATFNAEFADKGVLDYPVPHSNYRVLGTKRTANTFGIDGLYFIPTGSNVRPYVGLGIYSGERKEIAQSNVTGWYYNQGDRSKVAVAGELGVQFATEGGLIFGAGFHSLRGANLSIGKKF